MRKQKMLTGRVKVLGVGDTHVGSTLGLAPPKWYTTDGQNRIEHTHSPLQQIVYEHWKSAWGRQFKTGLPLVVFNTADDIDGHHHDTFQVWSKDPREQSDVAVSLFLPYRQKVARWYACKGTPAHAGQSGTWDEYIAQQLGADRPDDGGGFSSYMLKVEVSGVDFNVAHHGPRPGRRVWTLGDTARQYAKTIVMDELMSGNKPPDVILRGHVHTCIHETVRVAGHECHMIVVPAWQLRTEFINMVVTEHDIADIGMAVIDVEDGRVLDVSFDMMNLPESRRAVA